MVPTRLMHNSQLCDIIFKFDWHDYDDQNIFDDFQVLILYWGAYVV